MSGIVPIIGYDDQHAALAWLAEAFGFERGDVHEDGEGRIVHAEMTYGGGTIMFGREHVDGICTYVVVDDPDAHHARAKAAGAVITAELTDQDYGSREYGAQDFEGNQWYFGTYRPKAG